MSLLRSHHKPGNLLKQCSVQMNAYFSSQSLLAADDAQISPLIPYPKHCLKLPPWIKLTPIGKNPDLLKTVGVNCSKFLEAFGEKNFEMLFEKKVKPYLVARCILTNGAISDLSTKELHFMNKRLVRHVPSYVTSLSLMKCLVKHRLEYWAAIMHSLVVDRVIVIVDWDRELTPVQVMFYDHGLLLASQIGTSDSCTYKAECDASFKASNATTQSAARAGTATVASIIWKSRKMISSQITHGLPCEDSEHAESMAILSVLQRGRELQIENIDVVTDNLRSYKTMIGEQDVFGHKHRDVMLAAIKVAKEYEVCRFRYEPREQLCLVNEMANTEETNTPAELWDLEKIIEKHASCLWGLPVIRINQSTNGLIKKLAKAPVLGVDMSLVQKKNIM